MKGFKGPLLKAVGDWITKLLAQMISPLLAPLFVAAPYLWFWNQLEGAVKKLPSQLLLLIILGMLLTIVGLAAWVIRLRPSSKYTEEAGALFKKNKDGTFNFTPYCPACKSAMVPIDRHSPYQCGNKSCEQKANFNKIHFDRVIEALQKQV